jgi:hypothetical protein
MSRIAELQVRRDHLAEMKPIELDVPLFQRGLQGNYGSRRSRARCNALVRKWPIVLQKSFCVGVQKFCGL